MDGIVVTMPSNAIKAEKVIEIMPLGSWVDVRAVSKNAHLSACIMSKSLCRLERKASWRKKSFQTVLSGSIFGDASRDHLIEISVRG